MTIAEQAVQAAIGVLAEAKKKSGWTLMEPNSDTVTEMLTAAAPHLAAVRVKKLIWRPVIENGKDIQSFSALGNYVISIDDAPAGGTHYLWVAGQSDSSDYHSSYQNMFEAKAAAQADYEARILSAIEPSAGRAAVLEEVRGGIERIIHHHFKGPNLIDADWDRPTILGLDNGWRRQVELAASDIVSKLSSALHPLADKPDEAGAQGEGWMPTVCVGEMQTSAGADYYVCVKVGDREITPHMFKERWKAEYEVAEWQWLFNGGEKPDLLAYGPLPTPPSSEVA